MSIYNVSTFVFRPKPKHAKCWCIYEKGNKNGNALYVNITPLVSELAYAKRKTQTRMMTFISTNVGNMLFLQKTYISQKLPE